MRNVLKENRTKKILAVISIVAIMALAIIVAVSNGGKNNVAEDASKSVATVESKKLNEGDEVTSTGYITVHYQDENGTDLIQSVQHSGEIGTWYEFEPAEIEGYRSNSINPVNRCGYYEFASDDVIFKYTPLGDDYDVTWTNEGVDGAEDTVINVGVDNIRSTTEYGLIIITEDEDGNVVNGTEFKVSDGDTVVKEGAVQNGKLYVGKVGFNQDKTYTFGIEQTVEVEPYASMEGTATLSVGVEWDNTNKRFKITGSSIDNSKAQVSVNENNEIVVRILNEERELPPPPESTLNVRIEYKVDGKLVDGVTLGVDSGSGVVEKTTADGIIYLDNVVVRELGDLTYKVTEISVPDGIIPVMGEGVEGIATITPRLNQEGTGFDFSGRTNDIEGFSININGGNAVITVSAKAKKYDLSLKKFIDQIDDEYVENREPKVVMGKDGKYVYQTSNKIEKAANGQKVTYILRTYNESKIDGEGKRVIEYIPRGLKYLPDDTTNQQFGWRMYRVENDGVLVETTDINKAEVIATDYIEGQTIMGFDGNVAEGEEVSLNHLDVKAVFEVDESVFTGKENRIIENTASIGKNENDDNGDNDTTTEKIYVKYFDLKTTKYIKSVRTKNEKKDETKLYGESTDNSVIKVDVPKSQVNKTTLTVTYTIKVENVGEIAGYATKVVDYLPDGFEVVNKTDWTVDGQVATCTKLDSTLLMPGESTTIDIVCDWKLGDKQIGSRVNEASVTEYDNDYHSTDITPDNNDKEEIIAAITTGKTVFVATGIIFGIVAIIAIVYIRNKRKEGIA
ncbi:MAG: MucBP domain-containing protein [Clostridia bacterium]|nr:MucBP domain-containing protein [Clostridia bacterium]